MLCRGRLAAVGDVTEVALFLLVRDDAGGYGGSIALGVVAVVVGVVAVVFLTSCYSLAFRCIFLLWTERLPPVLRMSATVIHSCVTTDRGLLARGVSSCCCC